MGNLDSHSGDSSNIPYLGIHPACQDCHALSAINSLMRLSRYHPEITDGTNPVDYCTNKKCDRVMKLLN